MLVEATSAHTYNKSHNESERKKKCVLGDIKNVKARAPNSLD